MNQAVVNERRTFSRTLDVSELVNADVGAQGVVTLHEILPAGWAIIGAYYHTDVAFNGSGARTLNVGIPGTTTRIVSAQDIKAASSGTPATMLDTAFLATAPTRITTNLVTADNNPTAGQVTVFIEAVQMKREG